MHNGTIKKVEDVEQGDLVMGPDSKPRRVQWTHDGIDQFFRVTPKKGRPFDVNAGHVLMVKSRGKEVPVTAASWEMQSRNFRNLFKLYRTPIEHDRREHFLDPYLVGILIGDGCLRLTTSVATPDAEIEEAIRPMVEAARARLTRREFAGKCPVLAITTPRGQPNPIREEVVRLGLAVNSVDKHIPGEYLIDSIENRLQLLAGLLDTDGHLSKGTYDFVTASAKLASDVERLVLSVGLYGRVSPCVKTFQGGERKAYRICISGDLDRVPCRVSRKRAGVRRQIKDHLVTGFDLSDIGRGKFYGFHLDGDHLYVDGNYMVHHNTGKTRVATAMIARARTRGKKVVFYAPRRELIYQTSDQLDDEAQAHGILMAGERRHWAGVQVASFDTVWSQYRRRGTLPKADLVIVDEAHLSVSDTRKTILREHLNSGAVLIGLTATPARGDGRGLGEIYDDMIEAAPVSWFIEQGYLVPARYFAPSKPDLDAVRVARGDYVINDLGEAVDKPKLVGDIVAQWLRLAHGRSTVVFCVNRKHSRHVRDEFIKNGVRAEHVDGETPSTERAEILDRVRSGETTVLTNVFVASYGLDIPTLEVAVLARPTKSLALYHQTVGRVMRPAQGKTEAMVIDHAGAVEEHGLFSDPVPWTLDSAVKVQDAKEKAAKEQQAPKDLTCPACKTVFRARRDCPSCGFQMIGATEAIPHHEADLQEVGNTAARRNRLDSWDEKIEFIGGLKHHAREHGYKPGWVAHAYQSRYGVWPNDQRLKSADPVPPSPEVIGYVKYLRIRNARRSA